MKSGKLDGSGDGLSPKTLRNMHNMLHKALNQAVYLNMIAKNPVDYAVLPKRNKTEMRYFTKEEQKRLQEVIRGNRLEMPVLLDLYTGMRQGELLGLVWKNVHIDLDGQSYKKSQNLMDEVIPKKDVDKRILKDSEKKTDIQTEDTSILTNGLTTNSNLNDLIKDSTSENDNDLLGENEKKETNTAQIVKDYTLCDDTICLSEEVKIKSDLCVTEDTIQTESIYSESISPEITENEAITEVEIEKSDDILYESINKRIIEDEPVNVPDRNSNNKSVYSSKVSFKT